MSPPAPTFSYLVAPVGAASWPPAALARLPALLRLARRTLVTLETAFFQGFPEHCSEEEVVSYVEGFATRGAATATRDPVFEALYREVGLQATSLPPVPWRWHWAQVPLLLFSSSSSPPPFLLHLLPRCPSSSPPPCGRGVWRCRGSGSSSPAPPSSTPPHSL